jgi:hypothetical protein
MSNDPFAVLGLGREATLDDVRAARRRRQHGLCADRQRPFDRLSLI